jgi:hypothetical protein
MPLVVFQSYQTFELTVQDVPAEAVIQQVHVVQFVVVPVVA